jgi:hypothetical protein
MGAILYRVKCSKCGMLLLEFERGAKSDEVKVQRFGTHVVRAGIAKCDKCGGETPFDTKYVTAPKGEKGRR